MNGKNVNNYHANNVVLAKELPSITLCKYNKNATTLEMTGTSPKQPVCSENAHTPKYG